MLSLTAYTYTVAEIRDEVNIEVDSWRFTTRSQGHIHLKAPAKTKFSCGTPPPYAGLTFGTSRLRRSPRDYLMQSLHTHRCPQAGRLAGSAHTSSSAFLPYKRLCKGPSRPQTCRAQGGATAAAPAEKPLVAEVLRDDPVVRQKKELQQMMDREYKDGWRTIIESDTFAKGLTEDVVRAISAKKDEPEWLLNFRLKAFKRWLTMFEPRWSDNTYPDFDYQDISYYSAPKKKAELASLDDVDPAMRETWERLNIPIQEQKRLANVKPVARDLVFDSVSIATTFKKELAEHGVIFMSISEAVHEYPDLVRKHLGSVVSPLLHYSLPLH